VWENLQPLLDWSADTINMIVIKKEEEFEEKKEDEFVKKMVLI
jgi:hypothetical protein